MGIMNSQTHRLAMTLSPPEKEHLALSASDTNVHAQANTLLPEKNGSLSLPGMLGTTGAAVALGLIKVGTGRCSPGDAQGILGFAGFCSHITHNQHQTASSYGEKENY